MEFRTLTQLRSELKRSLDLEEEDFTQDTELNDYINAGIDKAESKIHSIYEDYFLTESYLALTSGTSEYDLPTGIYASKIRGITYSSGNLIYPVRKISTRRMFEAIAQIRYLSSSTQDYRYILKNTAPTNGSSLTGIKLLLLPAARETSTTNVVIWHIRNARRLSADADICDIPEFYHYILQYARVRVYEKEGHPGFMPAKALLDEYERDMVETLTDMIPDGENEMEQDYTHYEDMHGGGDSIV